MKTIFQSVRLFSSPITLRKKIPGKSRLLLLKYLANVNTKVIAEVAIWFHFITFAFVFHNRLPSYFQNGLHGTKSQLAESRFCHHSIRHSATYKMLRKTASKWSN